MGRHLPSYFRLCKNRKAALEWNLSIQMEIQRDQFPTESLFCLINDCHGIFREAAFRCKSDKVAIFIFCTVAVKIRWAALGCVSIAFVHLRCDDGLTGLKFHQKTSQIIEDRMSFVDFHTSHKVCAMSDHCIRSGINGLAADFLNKFRRLGRVPVLIDALMGVYRENGQIRTARSVFHTF